MRTTSPEWVRLDVRDGIADVRISRPEKNNALTPIMFEALSEVGERLLRMRGVRCVVLSGEGPSFSAGLDRETFAHIAANCLNPEDDLLSRTNGLANGPQHAALIWRFLPAPVIAAIHGAAFGAGLHVALGADLRFVTKDAQLSFLEVKWGLAPDMGGLYLLRGSMRRDVARELAFTGRIVRGDEAVACGLATRVCADPLAAAFETAREIAGRSPDAVRAIKRLFNRVDEEDMATILMAESSEQSALMRSPNVVEAMLAGLEPRPPRFIDPD